ncbi:MAG: radical SAM protein [Zoogloeaceae bacterium]|nr:radical SAM protein [Zoogloeaceae bacterium]
MISGTKGVLGFADHDRTAVGMRYVYPVVSRRAGGVSVGINLNPNNACNWQCIYCQVPGLVRGGPPPIDLPLLQEELTAFLHELLHDGFMERHVPEGLRRICDIAFSGNGEPTSSESFDEAIELVGRVREASGLLAESVPIRLITNGSLMGREGVRKGISRLAGLGGEAWFKLDGGRAEDYLDINGVSLDPARVVRNLRACADRCPTWVQTCLFVRDGRAPDEAMMSSYLDLLDRAGVERLKGVLLYGVVRPSMQPGAARIAALTQDQLGSYAKMIEKKGLTVRVSP